ncbi:hypothetical protein L6452_23320 [Arctium lappa]|uniref:Uncharacterized protein n=1 Tax=Arctium lappa TaxID=4217 RepID=A0ACB9B247_ARCLA|nr:hypothetical protein L6452_23320 [Arctium lappa]
MEKLKGKEGGATMDKTKDACQNGSFQDLLCENLELEKGYCKKPFVGQQVHTLEVPIWIGTEVSNYPPSSNSDIVSSLQLREDHIDNNKEKEEDDEDSCNMLDQ